MTHISVRMTDSDKKAIRLAAKTEGLSVSGLLRQCYEQHPTFHAIRLLHDAKMAAEAIDEAIREPLVEPFELNGLESRVISCLETGPLTLADIYRRACTSARRDVSHMIITRKMLKNLLPELVRLVKVGAISCTGNPLSEKWFLTRVGQELANES